MIDSLKTSRQRLLQATHRACWRWRTRRQPEPRLNAWGAIDNGYW